MKKQHFPAIHPGVLYIEKGETRWSFKKEDKTKVTLEEPSLVEASTNVKDASVVEEAQDMDQGAAALGEVDAAQHEGAVALEHKSKQEINPNSDVSTERLLELEEILKLQNLMIFQQKVKHEAGNVTATNVKEKLDLIQSSKSIEELCIRGGLSFFESENKVICYICCHKDLTGNDVVRKLGEFGYDSFQCGVDFTNKSKPRDFRNLKKV